MSTVTSRDGTAIAFERQGQGPPVILVDGALCHRRMGPMSSLARRLATRLTVFTYDRRGRGESGNTLPWARDREVEDIAALIAEAGGSAGLFGISSGAVLALDATARGLAVSRLAVYEPPFIVDGTRAPVADDFIPGLDRLLARGDRSEVVKRFLRLVGAPGFAIALMRLLPNWSRLTAVAHTLPYDLTITRGTQEGKPLPPDRWSGVTTPSLVLDGGKSPAWMRNGARALGALLPAASCHTLPGQTHMVKPEVLAPVLTAFFTPV